MDLQRFLVPSQPHYDDDGNIISGKNPEVGVVAGMVQSSHDARGVLVTDDNGDPVQNADGSYQVEANSKLIEELNEINIATGFEYWYNDLIALRTGLFYEHATKGGRKYFNAGVGLKYNSLNIDISYLGAFTNANPLANTLRFTLRMTLGK